MLVLGLFWLLLPWSWAQGVTGAPPELRRDADGLTLSARLPLELPAGLEEVMLRGVPVHFVWQADVRRQRWYWLDRRLVSAQRSVRVAYQPLTRRWRVSVSAGVPSEAPLAGALHRNLDTYTEAMVAALGVARWKLADAQVLPHAGDLRVDFQIRMEGGLLAGPFQSGGPGQVEWGVLYRVTLSVPVHPPVQPPVLPPVQPPEQSPVQPPQGELPKDPA